MLPVYLAELELQTRRAALERALVQRAHRAEAQRHHRRTWLPRRFRLALGRRLVVWGERLQHSHTTALPMS